MAVSDSLRARISNREIPPGAILPSEMELTTEFGVSRSVVRQALRTLADEGLIQVSPGRGAVVATHAEWHRDAQRTAGLSTQMRALKARVNTRVLSYAVRSGGAEATRLGCKDVLVLERLRYLDGEPVAYIRTWLPGWVAEKVTSGDLEDASLHMRLHEHAGVDVHGGPRQIHAVGVTGEMAERLAVPTGSPVLQLTGESLDQDGKPVEIFSTWHRSDRIALDITIIDPVVATPEGSDTLSASAGGALAQAERSLRDALRAIRKAATEN
ncbi:GntR family transcriptional regulator [Ornithinimicrobium pratense]|uniref:GntR family transcriptional regulator n=1 Tax=Ornithinimicrobium pratense TaxID=2593973 RepID=UPI0017879AEE|nr:GntR family transcriptional regulator [Ornithinimicrobium pratense]